MKTMRRLMISAAIAVALAAVGAAASSDAALFTAYTPVTLKLEAPLNELFDRGRDNDAYAVIGKLTGGGENGSEAVSIENVKISLRGNTSRRESECSFPKLKLRFSTPPHDPPFAGLTTVKVGSHCGEAAEGVLTRRFGRLANEQAPLHEVFVYRLLETLQVPALKARPARITYVFTDGPKGTTGTQRQRAPVTRNVTRNAMLLEDDDDARKRLGAAQEIQPTEFSNATEQFAAADTAQLAFAQAMIGNFDWCLKFTADDQYRCDARRILWNVMAFRGNGRTFPVMYDFDVSGMVAGHHRWFADVYNEAFVPSKSHPEVEVLGQVQRTRALFPRDVLDATRARFMERKAEAYRALQEATLDEPGRRRIQEYLDAFYNAIGSDAAFYRPVVTAPNTMPYTTADKTAVVCDARGAIPIGTAVGEPLATSGSMIQVVLLDTQWNWATPVTCPEIHKGAVWIDSSAVSNDFPKAAVPTR